MWIRDDTIKSGLTDVGSGSTPAIFYDGSTLKLISGAWSNSFYGWYWNGTAWVPDATASAMSGFGSGNSPTVFLDGSTLKLLSGTHMGVWYSWRWTGSAWTSDSSISDGLPYDMGFYGTPHVFLDGSTLKLIYGEGNGNFAGYRWTGSTWTSDSSIISGLTDVGYRSAPTVFLDGSTWKLISGENDGVFNGWYWSGSTWIPDSSIVLGLSDVGSYSSPDVFLDGSTLKLISGETGGVWNSWYWGEVFSLSGTISNENGFVNNAAITLSGAGGSTTSNEIGYYEITGILPDSYIINVTEVLHYNYSDTVTITSDTEKNIFLTVIPTSTPTIIPIVAPPPLIPIQEPTPFVEIQKQEISIENIMMQIENFTLEEVFKKIMVFVGKGLTWTFLLASYIGAILSQVSMKRDEKEENIFDTFLSGTLGWVLLLLINTTGYITIVTASFALNSLIFGIGGFVAYTILDTVTSKE